MEIYGKHFAKRRLSYSLKSWILQPFLYYVYDPFQDCLHAVSVSINFIFCYCRHWYRHLISVFGGGGRPSCILPKHSNEISGSGFPRGNHLWIAVVSCGYIFLASGFSALGWVFISSSAGLSGLNITLEPLICFSPLPTPWGQLHVVAKPSSMRVHRGFESTRCLSWL